MLLQMSANWDWLKGLPPQGSTNISVYWRGWRRMGAFIEFERTTTPLSSADHDSRFVWLIDINPRDVRSSRAVVNMSASFQSLVGCVREKISPFTRCAISADWFVQPLSPVNGAASDLK